MGTTALLALGFANLAMLGWLAAASIPLVIHLWNRRRYREVSWAAIDFLLAAVRKNARRLLLEQWLLLALRTLLILLLVLAVAEPFWEARAARFAAGTPTHRVLLIDASLSMAYRPTEQSRFERARELAQQALDEGGSGDAFSLILLADLPAAVVASPAFDPRTISKEIEGLELTHGRADLPSALALAEDVVRRAKHEFPRLQQAEVCLITDLGRSTITGASAEQTAQCRRRAASLSRHAAITVVDVGQERSENVSVAAVRLLDPLVTVRRDVAIEADLRNFGSQPKSQQVVELLVDGNQVASELVDLEPDGRVSLAFHHRFDAAGPHLLEVRLAPDLLDEDNHRWQVVEAKESLRALCIDGEIQSALRGGATRYLSVALAPEEQASRNVVRTDVEPETALVETDLAAYDALFLCHVARFTPNEARLLSSYVQQGGGLVIFLGPSVQLENYNQHLAAADGVDLLPGRLLELSAEGQYTLDPLDYAHPLLAVFRDNPRTGLAAALVTRYARVVPHETARVVARFSSGDPAIVERSVGRGRVLLVATSADTTWSVLPVLPAYVPLAQELVSRILRQPSADRNLQVGQPIVSTARVAAAIVDVERPDEKHDTIRPSTESRGTTWEYASTTRSGAYTARSSGSSEVFAVNVDPLESDLARVDGPELAAETWNGVPHVVRTKWEQLDAPLVGEGGPRSNLAQGVLWVVAGLVLSELGLAWYFGNRNA